MTTQMSANNIYKDMNVEAIAQQQKVEVKGEVVLFCI